MLTVKELREKNGYTLADVSRILGVSVSVIKSYEKFPGKTPIHVIAEINPYSRNSRENVFLIDQNLTKII